MFQQPVIYWIDIFEMVRIVLLYCFCNVITLRNRFEPFDFVQLILEFILSVPGNWFAKGLPKFMQAVKTFSSISFFLMSHRKLFASAKQLHWSEVAKVRGTNHMLLYLNRKNILPVN